MKNKTVAAKQETYELLLKLQGKLQSESDERIGISDALHTAVYYLNKNYKKISQSDQLLLPLKKQNP